MRLSFSTLGCPAWSFDEIIANAGRMGFDGVGFRGIGSSLDLRQVPEFAPGMRAATRRRIADAGLETAILLASTKLTAAEPVEAEKHLQECRDYLELAADLECPAVRVFGGAIPGGMSIAAAVKRGAERLNALARHAEPLGVRVLFETHDDWVDPQRAAALMKATDHPAARLLWDVHHPWRIGGFPIEATYNTLRPWIAGIDLKDSTEDFSTPMGYRYVLTGEGEVPLADAVRLLAAGGYGGWLSFEWEKRWHPEIEEPEIAFPHFIDYAMKQFGGDSR